LWHRTADTLPSYLRYEGVRVNHCGIHSISISSEGMIATGGQEPKDIMLISSHDFRPRGLLRGHDDWVFGIAWVDHRILVSGSRDKQVRPPPPPSSRVSLIQANSLPPLSSRIRQQGQAGVPVERFHTDPYFSPSRGFTDLTLTSGVVCLVL
jgi:hypothetical protein